MMDPSPPQEDIVNAHVLLQEISLAVGEDLQDDDDYVAVLEQLICDLDAIEHNLQTALDAFDTRDAHAQGDDEDNADSTQHEHLEVFLRREFPTKLEKQQRIRDEPRSGTKTISMNQANAILSEKISERQRARDTYLAALEHKVYRQRVQIRDKEKKWHRMQQLQKEEQHHNHRKRLEARGMTRKQPLQSDRSFLKTVPLSSFYFHIRDEASRQRTNSKPSTLQRRLNYKPTSSKGLPKTVGSLVSKATENSEPDVNYTSLDHWKLRAAQSVLQAWFSLEGKQTTQHQTSLCEIGGCIQQCKRLLEADERMSSIVQQSIVPDLQRRFITTSTSPTIVPVCTIQDSCATVVSRHPQSSLVYQDEVCTTCDVDQSGNTHVHPSPLSISSIECHKLVAKRKIWQQDW